MRIWIGIIIALKIISIVVLIWLVIILFKYISTEGLKNIIMGLCEGVK